jgi:hypothetical protein
MLYRQARDRRPLSNAWINRGKEPCRIVFVLMDSKQP